MAKKVLEVFCSDKNLLPFYNHSSDAAFDLKSSGEFVVGSGVDEKKFVQTSFTLKPNQRVLVKTGIKIAIPKNCFGSIRDRSGIALKDGITVLGGVIDSEYRGEIGVILFNTSSKDFVINKYDRIAQMIIQSFVSVKIKQRHKSFGETSRGEKGFGSSGKK